MKKSEELLRELRRKGEELEIPKGLEPEWMQETLEEYDRKQYFRRGKVYPALAMAACLCLIAGAMLKMHRMGLLFPAEEAPVQVEDVTLAGKDPTEGMAGDAQSTGQEEVEQLDLPELTYEEIYAKLSANWQPAIAETDIVRGDVFVDTGTTNGTAAGAAVDEGIEDFAAADSVMEESAAAESQKQYRGEESESFGKTNVQVEEIDEADRIKNDGRYLYQIAVREEKSEGEDTARGRQSYGIQIVDTKEGLKEAAFLDGFDSIEEFYVWEDLLITIENKYYEAPDAVPLAEEQGMAACYDMAYKPNCYHEIRVFDIADRGNPKEVKTFTLQGSYESSRISDGYFYGISRFTARPGEGEMDYDAYIPTVDGAKISADKIYCPEYEGGTSYLVLVSVDLKDPTELKDSRAVLAGSGLYYMSRRNLYMTYYKSVYANTPEKEGTFTDKTKFLRFAYLNGQFYAQAEGEVPGRLESSFSLDEYNGNLRVVSTVQTYDAKQVQDDRTGEVLGFDFGSAVQTNALYVLDKDFSIKGKIEGLAEEEQIYSARFLGDTGYFVTFRQTDPLFAVDLSDPENPKVLGELKVSGFSEYLHFWGEDLLLGIGMEADEETGQQEGLKLSMFDISEPAELNEAARKELTNYSYSEVLYDHKAVLIDVGENLIGFCAEGSNRGEYWRDYVVYSYESGEFIQKMKLNAKAEDGGYYRTRGTFIGDVFYLLSENGSVEAYSRESGALLEKI